MTQINEDAARRGTEPGSDEPTKEEQEAEAFVARLKACPEVCAAVDAAVQELYPEEYDPERQAAFREMASEWSERSARRQLRNQDFAEATPLSLDELEQQEGEDAFRVVKAVLDANPGLAIAVAETMEKHFPAANDPALDPAFQRFTEELAEDRRQRRLNRQYSAEGITTE